MNHVLASVQESIQQCISINQYNHIMDLQELDKDSHFVKFDSEKSIKWLLRKYTRIYRAMAQQELDNKHISHKKTPKSKKVGISSGFQLGYDLKLSEFLDTKNISSDSENYSTATFPPEEIEKIQRFSLQAICDY